MSIEFCQKLFLHLLDYYMVFIPQFVNMVYDTDWFAHIEEFLDPWDKPDLIMLYDLFNVLLDSIY